MAPFDGIQSPSQGPRHTKDVIKMVPVVTPNWCQSPLLFGANAQFILINFLIVFMFCHMFQIKRLNSACSVVYLHRECNTIVLMHVNLFFIKIIKASIIDSMTIIKY